MSQVLDINTPDLYSSTQPEARSIWLAIRRGLAMRCPKCGKGKLFRKYLKVADACSNCHQNLSLHQADDAPPYFTILIVGHVVVPIMLAVEVEYAPPIWLHMTIWPTLALGMSLFLLPRLKGAVVGLQWAARMHGFGDEAAD